jgi:hypothetical protein
MTRLLARHQGESGGELLLTHRVIPFAENVAEYREREEFRMLTWNTIS